MPPRYPIIQFSSTRIHLFIGVELEIFSYAVLSRDYVNL